MQVSNFDSRLIISNFELLIITVSIKFYLKSTSSDNILIEVNHLPMTLRPFLVDAKSNFFLSYEIIHIIIASGLSRLKRKKNIFNLHIINQTLIYKVL